MVSWMAGCKKALYVDGIVKCLDNDTELDVYEALYRLKRGDLIVFSHKKESLSWIELARIHSKRDPTVWIMFSVYYDLRERGRRVKPGPHQNGFTLYVGEKPVASVFVAEETVSFKIRRLIEWLEYSRRIGREAIMAIVDKHGDVSYYVFEKFS